MNDSKEKPFDHFDDSDGKVTFWDLLNQSIDIDAAIPLQYSSLVSIREQVGKLTADDKPCIS